MARGARDARQGRVRPILQYKNETERQILRQRSQPVTRVNREIRQLVDDMLATMYDADGIGLAAPQVGVLRRVIVADVGDGPVVIINPEVHHQEGSEEAYEGCLSIPGYQGRVARAGLVRVSGLDEKGRRVWLEAEGLLARAIQHEIDHLDGILFLDRASKIIELSPAADLRIVYMGTPGFAVEPLRHLLRNHCRVTAVVTRPDRPRGRGRAVKPSPVKELAAELGLPVLQPEKAGDPEFVAQLRELEPDVIVTAAYGLLLPPEVLEVPRLGCLNIHPSLLPELRGAAPIQRALMEGKEKTGVTIYFMDEGMDSGDILLQEETPIQPGETAGELAARLSKMGARLLMDALRLLATEEDPPRRPQDHSRATFAPALQPHEERIDWSWPAEKIVNHCRGLAPRPGAYTLYRGERLKILAAEVRPGEAGAPPGTVIAVEKNQGFVVAAGTGAVLVKRVQLAGRQAVSAADFINGHPLDEGEALGLEPVATSTTEGKGGSIDAV
ncbi:MAG TPA: methionyl-tRNA formyltransferase [Sphingobacteriaceae bacterium]|nr:methionyl-tRNA formyltransferase [Sphingobacteriaceae bacterium]